MRIFRASISALVSTGLIICAHAAAAADDPGLRELLEKAIARRGGDKLARVNATSLKMKGVVQVNGAPVPFTGEVETERGDRQRISVTVTVDGQAIPYASVVNGEQGWIKIGDNTVQMPADKIADAREAAYVTWVMALVPLRDKAFQLAPFGEIDINGRKAVGINVTRDGHRSINLFFDKETLRLVRTETVIREEFTLKEVTEVTTFSDDKEYNGISHASKIVVQRNGQDYLDAEVEDYKPVEKLDNGLFEKP